MIKLLILCFHMIHIIRMIVSIKLSSDLAKLEPGEEIMGLVKNVKQMTSYDASWFRCITR